MGLGRGLGGQLLSKLFMREFEVFEGSEIYESF